MAGQKTSVRKGECVHSRKGSSADGGGCFVSLLSAAEDCDN